MINAIIKGIFKLIMGLVNLLLLPIDALITQFLPDVSSALNHVNDFFDLIGSYLPWVISYTGLLGLMSPIILIVTFILTVPLMVKTIKLALKWYNKLKL